MPAAARHDVVERLALDVLHGVEGRAVVLAGAEEADDVGVLELLEDCRLRARSGPGAFVAAAGRAT